MADALTQVEELLASALRAWPELGNKIVRTDLSKDTAPDDPGNLIRIYTVGSSFEQSTMNGATEWAAIVEFEVTSMSQVAGTISAENRTTLAHIMGALAADRTLGGMLQDIQEIDIASVMPNGRDLGAASLQCRVEFYTPRDDWFTLLAS